jgi:hypothetical protein
MMALAIFRPLNVLLRKVGMHNGKLPLDIAQRLYARYLLLVLGAVDIVYTFAD